jgi:hypothetical protein
MFQGQYNLTKKKYLHLVKQFGGVIINLEQKFKGGTSEDLKQFINEFIGENDPTKVTENEMYFWRILEINTIKYPCIIKKYKNDNAPTLDDLFSFIELYFLNSYCDIEKQKDEIINKPYNYAFLQISFSPADMLTTNIPFHTFKNQNKLQTSLEILDIMYEYFGKDKIILSDEAEFKCPSSTDQSINKCEQYIEVKNNTYSAKMFRILKTELPFERISIYTSHGYKNKIQQEYKNICTNDSLKKIRNMPLNKFLSLLDIYVKNIYPQLQSISDNPEHTIVKDNFIFADPFSSIIYVTSIMEKDPNKDNQTIHTFFQNMEIDNTTCEIFNKMMNIISRFWYMKKNLKKYSGKYDKYFDPIMELINYFSDFAEFLYYCISYIEKNLVN